jgi:large subunit ribosomal protein L22
MEASARLRNNPRTNNNAGSPRKVRLVADQIRGLDLDKALAILRYSNKAASRNVEKTLLCAVNNWKQKFDLDPEDHDLFVKQIFVDAGKVLKRFQPAPHGRAHRIRKRSNHLTIVVGSRSPIQVAAADNAEENQD